MERYEHVDLQLRRQAATENSQMRTVGLYNIGLCDGGVHSLVVLCLAQVDLFCRLTVTGITAFALGYLCSVWK